VLQINGCEDGEKSNIVIIGGLVDSLLFVDQEIKNTGVIGLGIAGSAVQAVSIVHHGETPSGVTKSLQQLHNFDISCSDSCACFMVSCVGRGEKFYSARNVESKIFKQVFPKVPVGGFFGNGELGLDLQSTEGQPLKDSHFLHSYSSVFCLCSLEAGKKTAEGVSPSLSGNSSKQENQGEMVKTLCN
jgi:F-box protein 22